MNGESLCRAERGVSTVVGVVLLMGITVLLVAGVATLTTGVAGEAPTDEQVDTQQSVFSFEYADNVTYDPPVWVPGEYQLDTVHRDDAFLADILTITYESGSSLPSDDIVVRMEGEGTGFKCIDDTDNLSCGSYHNSSATFADIGVGSQVTSGDTVRITTIVDDVYGAEGRPVSAEMDVATVRVIYEPDSGDSSTVLAEWEGPEA